MTSYLDIYRIASVLIREHGEDAAVEAAERADAMLKNDDPDAAAVWKWVTLAVEDIQRTELGRLGSVATKTVAQSLSAAPGAVRSWIVIRRLRISVDCGNLNLTRSDRRSPAQDLRVVRRLPTEFVAVAQSRQASDSPSQKATFKFLDLAQRTSVGPVYWARDARNIPADLRSDNNKA